MNLVCVHNCITRKDKIKQAIFVSLNSHKMNLDETA